MNNNILFVANWESDVGYAWWLMENFWVTLARHFANEGRRCVLIYPSITTVPDTIRASPITVLEHDFEDLSLKGASRLRRILSKHDIGYVYLSDKPPWRPAYLLLRAWGVKRIAVHEHTPGQRTIPAGAKASIKHILANMPGVTADRFIAVTTFVRERMTRCTLIPDWKCSVAPNGIEPIGRAPEYRHYCHDQFNIPEDATIIISTGRATYYKGVDFIIRCANELIHHRGRDDLYFLYAGDGPDMGDFRKLSEDLDLGHRFLLPGQRADVRQLIQSAHIGFHASKGEVGYSLSILELMSAGLATAVPDNPSTNLATRHERNGLLYTPEDIHSACDALDRLHRDPQLRAQLGQNASRDVADHYNLQLTNTALVDILSREFSNDTPVHTRAPTRH